MNTKVLLGIVVVIIAIGGVVGCSILLPAQKTVQTPAAEVQNNAGETNTQGNTAAEKNTENDVNAGETICTKCGGDGVIKCTKCGGDGKIGSGSCTTCGGDGKVYYDENGKMHPNVVKILQVLACHSDTCPTCHGAGGGSSKTCTACGGDGLIPCSACGGDGYI